MRVQLGDAAAPPVARAVPCSKGMRACASSCAHRRFVLDYIAERDRQALEAEAVSNGHATETAEFYALVGRVTFKRWLEHHAGADYPYPNVASRPPELPACWPTEPLEVAA